MRGGCRRCSAWNLGALDSSRQEELNGDFGFKKNIPVKELSRIYETVNKKNQNETQWF